MYAYRVVENVAFHISHAIDLNSLTKWCVRGNGYIVRLVRNDVSCERASVTVSDRVGEKISVPATSTPVHEYARSPIITIRESTSSSI